MILQVDVLVHVCAYLRKCSCAENVDAGMNRCDKRTLSRASPAGVTQTQAHTQTHPASYSKLLKLSETVIAHDAGIPTEEKNNGIVRFSPIRLFSERLPLSISW